MIKSASVIGYALPISILGFDSYLKNIGSMRNTGWDITLNGRLVNTNDFTWDLTLMGSTIKNKVLHLADKPEIISGNYIIKEGETINSFYTAKSAGVDPATGSQLYWVWDTDENGNPGEPYISSNINKATASKQIMGSRIPNLYGSNKVAMLLKLAFAPAGRVEP